MLVSLVVGKHEKKWGLLLSATIEQMPLKYDITLPPMSIYWFPSFTGSVKIFTRRFRATENIPAALIIILNPSQIVRRLTFLTPSLTTRLIQKFV